MSILPVLWVLCHNFKKKLNFHVTEADRIDLILQLVPPGNSLVWPWNLLFRPSVEQQCFSPNKRFLGKDDDARFGHTKVSLF